MKALVGSNPTLSAIKNAQTRMNTEQFQKAMEKLKNKAKIF